MGDPPRLSVAILARDEEPNIARAIESARALAYEVVVLDTGSRDRTVAIAESHGARVVHHAWEDNFGSARNRLIEACQGDWVLMLDADEIVSQIFLEQWSGVSFEADAFLIPVLDMDEDSPRQTVWATRLFRRDDRFRYEGRIHEEIAPSVVRAGGGLGEAMLPIVHFGYVPTEDLRKDRRSRNLLLLSAEHEAHPDDVRVLHYLGLEWVAAGELQKAQPLLERALAEHPDAPLSGWTASLLSEVYLRQGRQGDAWAAAYLGLDRREGRDMCLVRVGSLAVEEGDHETALVCAADLEAVPLGTQVTVPRRLAIAIELRAQALAERGEKLQALEVLAQGVRSFTADARLADRLVRLSEEVHGGVTGSVRALRQAGTPFVLAATVGAMLRRQDYARAFELSERSAAPSVYRAHVLTHVGRAEEGIELLFQLGAEGRRHALLLALETQDRQLLLRATRLDPAPSRETARALLEGAPIHEDRAHLVWDWIRYWLDYRGRDLAIRLAHAAGGSEVWGRLALLFHRAGLTREAVALAAAAPVAPGALEVFAADADARGDVRSLADLCLARAMQTDAPVRTYRRGAEALIQLGEVDKASELIAAGRHARPFARFG